MGQYILITGLASSLVVFFTVTSSKPDAEEPVASAYVVSDIAEPEEFQASSGSALATAAFGMSALQPRTYNRDVVVEIIQASPLSDAEKSRLNGYLQKADAGSENLTVVLKNIRIALAVN